MHARREDGMASLGLGPVAFAIAAWNNWAIAVDLRRWLFVFTPRAGLRITR